MMTEKDVDVFYDPPRMEGEERQRVFGRGLDAIIEEDEREGYESATINLVGFRASAVDLGWLHDRIREYWFRERPDPDEARKAITKGIRQVVQRAKKVEVEVTEKLVSVILVTKDDFSYYEYRVQVYIEKDIHPDGRPRLRVACPQD